MRLRLRLVLRLVCQSLWFKLKVMDGVEGSNVDSPRSGTPRTQYNESMLVRVVVKKGP